MVVMFSARRLKPGAWEQFRRAWDPGDERPPGFQPTRAAATRLVPTKAAVVKRVRYPKKRPWKDPGMRCFIQYIHALPLALVSSDETQAENAAIANHWRAGNGPPRR